ncbi:MAG: ECF transporter S component [Anaerocolumna sp.]
MNKTKKLVITALMTAMTCIATMMIKVPSPTGGYIHLGDGLVLLSGILLGPIWGSLAAGLGSMLADILSSYAIYAPGTFIIKALAALAGSLLFHQFSKSVHKPKVKPLLLIGAGTLGGIVVTIGYFIFEAYFMGMGSSTALINIPFNIVQNLFGIIVSTLLYPVLTKVTVIKELSYAK